MTKCPNCHQTLWGPRTNPDCPTCSQIEMVSLAHIGGKLRALVMSPWPLKMGKVTRSLGFLHRASCKLHPEAFSIKVPDLYKCCACPAWRNYLHRSIKGLPVSMDLTDEAAQ